MAPQVTGVTTTRRRSRIRPYVPTEPTPADEVAASAVRVARFIYDAARRDRDDLGDAFYEVRALATDSLIIARNPASSPRVRAAAVGCLGELARIWLTPVEYRALARGEMLLHDE